MTNEFKQLEKLNLLLGWGFSFVTTWRLLELFSGYSIKSVLFASLICSMVFGAFSLISFDRTKEQKAIGGFLVLLFVFISLMFFLNGSLKRMNNEIILFDFIGVSYMFATFFSFVFWYFTFKVYRFIVLFGTSSFIFGLGLMQSQSIDFSYIILIILTLIGWVERTRRKSNIKNIRHDYVYLKGVGVLSVITLAVLFITSNFFTIDLPRSATLDSAINSQFSNLKVNAQAGMGGVLPSNSVLMNPFDYSGQVIKNAQQPLDTTVILKIEGDNPGYLKTQGLSIYSNNKWTCEDNELDGEDPYNQYFNQNIPNVKSHMNKLSCLITCIKSTNRTIPAPPATFDIDLRKMQSACYVTELGDLFLSKEYRSFENQQYTLRFIDATKKNSQIQDLKISNSIRSSLLSVPQDLEQKLKDLSLKIVAGAKTDFEKAVALESYFTKSGFKYVLNPEPIPKGYEPIDYFLFNSKQGNCTSFASAMVLMARSLDIPARYNVGFLTANSDEKDGKILVRVKDAHAFPELFIPGTGWQVFEPTVSLNEALNTNETDTAETETSSLKAINIPFQFIIKWFGNKSILERVLIIILLIASLSILIIIQASLRRAIRRRMYPIKEHSKNRGYRKAIVLYYETLNALKLLGISSNKGETPLAFAKRVNAETGICLCEWVQELNQFYFSHNNKYIRIDKSSKKYFKKLLLEIRKKVSHGKYFNQRWLLGKF